MMIEIQELSKSFKDVEAVKGISFSVTKGEVFGLLGENGAGKTTTLRLLATMLMPTSGTARLASHDITAEPHKVRKAIGILFGGESGLYDRLSARENIAYYGQLNDLSPQEIKNRIQYLSATLGMEDYIDRKVGKFSKGMKQKVSIARSIIHSPSIMLFDEPTAGLDVSAARVIHKFITSCKDEGKTVLFSSHSMHEVEKLCDRVAVIHKGAIVEQGKIDSLKLKYGKGLEGIFLELVGETDEL